MSVSSGRSRGVYRRRRLAALLFVGVLAAALYAGADSEAGTRPVSYTVAPGDTLWSIVTTHYPPTEDPRPIIEEIRATNGLEGYGIQPGSRLEIPRPPAG